MTEKSAKARERAKRLIRELQNRTVDRGFTEAEAMQATEQLGKLLEDYDLTIDEVGVREDAEQCDKKRVFAADQAAGSMVTGIKIFCNLVAYREKSNHTSYVLFGTPHDLEIALYLYEMLSEAVERDWTDYMETYGYSLKARLSFRAGFANRVYSRLMQLKEERDARMRQQTGTALMVLKDQLVTSEFAKKFPSVRLVKSRGTSVADGNAYRSGQAAGSRANLNNPLGDPSSRATTLPR